MSNVGERMCVPTNWYHAAGPHDLPNSCSAPLPPAPGPQAVAAKDGSKYRQVHHEEDKSVAGEDAYMATLGKVSGAGLRLGRVSTGLVWVCKVHD